MPGTVNRIHCCFRFTGNECSEKQRDLSRVAEVESGRVGSRTLLKSQGTRGDREGRRGKNGRWREKREMGGREPLGTQLASPRGRGRGRGGGGAAAAPPRPGCGGGGAACARSALGWGGLAHNEWPPRLPLLLRRRPRRPRRRRPRPRRRGARPGPRPGPSRRCGARREPPERGHGAGEAARPRPGSGLVSPGRPEGIRGPVEG